MSKLPPVSNPFADVPKCGAKTRKGSPCRSPAMTNGRCRLHGGLSTGAKTPEGLARCGNWKHGRYSKLEKQRKALVRELCHNGHIE
jgi:hypothetical protein